MPIGVMGVFATISGPYQPGFVCLQHIFGIAGIGANSANSISLGAEMGIAGIVQLDPCEGLILWKSEAVSTGTSAVVKPLTTSGRSLGGGPLGLRPGVNNESRANSSGLLMRI